MVHADLIHTSKGFKSLYDPIRMAEEAARGSCAGAMRENIIDSGQPDSMEESEPQIVSGAVSAACSAGLGTRS